MERLSRHSNCWPRGRSLWPLALFAVLLSLGSACTVAAPAPTPTKAPLSSPTAVAPSATVAAPTTAPAKPTAAPTTAPVSVKIGVLGLTADAGAYIAQERGYFAQEGLKVELVTFRGGGEMIAPLATGDLDLGGGAMSAALFNAIKRDVPLKVVADRGWVPPDRGGGAALVARKELVQSGQLKNFSDLKGMTLASNAEASAGDLGIMRAVELGKLTPQDVKIVRIPFPQMMTAFASKSIDVSYQVEPFVTMGTDQGITLPWKPLNEVVPNQQVGVWLYGPRFMKDKPEAAKRTMVALLKAVRDYNDAFFKNKGKAEVVAIFAKYTAVKDVPLYDRMDPAVLSPDGQLLLKDLMDQQDWYLSKGYMTEKVGLQDLVDTQYVEYASGRLGKYQ